MRARLSSFLFVLAAVVGCGEKEPAMQPVDPDGPVAAAQDVAEVVRVKMAQNDVGKAPPWLPPPCHPMHGPRPTVEQQPGLADLDEETR